MSNNNHGGVRFGAGRKKSEETKLVRVPVGVLVAVQSLIKIYKSKSKSKSKAKAK